ncbi:VOC family protein [Actinomadura sp. LOL_016]|uniref:VOC family protein n=1 Tax=Actinomadura sp. LOL_016 TaxID=3345411 RepID=UPI003A847406
MSGSMVVNRGENTMLRGLTTVSFYAGDVAAAADWYAALLGAEPYFRRPADGPPAYVEFRIGGHEHELGIIDARYAPHDGTGGAIAYWHVDDVQAALDRLVELGATVHEKVAERAPGSSPPPSATRSATSWASCTTGTTWR